MKRQFCAKIGILGLIGLLVTSLLAMKLPHHHHDDGRICVEQKEAADHSQTETDHSGSEGECPISHLDSDYKSVYTFDNLSGSDIVALPVESLLVVPRTVQTIDSGQESLAENPKRIYWIRSHKLRGAPFFS